MQVWECPKDVRPRLELDVVELGAEQVRQGQGPKCMVEVEIHVERGLVGGGQVQYLLHLSGGSESHAGESPPMI